jgi:hypothetical protein
LHVVAGELRLDIQAHGHGDVMLAITAEGMACLCSGR